MCAHGEHSVFSCYPSGPPSPEVRWGGSKICVLRALSPTPATHPYPAHKPPLPSSPQIFAQAAPSGPLPRHSQLRKSFSSFRIQRQSLQGSSHKHTSTLSPNKSLPSLDPAPPDTRGAHCVEIICVTQGPPRFSS